MIPGCSDVNRQWPNLIREVAEARKEFLLADDCPPVF